MGLGLNDIGNGIGDAFQGIGNMFGIGSAPQGSKFYRPNPPPPPDFEQLIKTQAQQNRINQNTPWGSLTYTTDKNGNPVANYQLSPQYQKLSSQLFGNMSNASQFKPGNLITNAGLTTGYNQNIANRYFGQEMRMINPQIRQQQNQFNQNLADRGLPAGSQLADSMTRDFNSGINNMRLQAANSAIGQGLDYTNAQNAARLQAAGFSNTAQQQQQQANQSYLQSLQQMYGMFTPGLNSMFAPGGVDVNGSANLAQNAMNQAFNSQMSAYNANMQGLYGLGAAGIGAYGSYLAGAGG